MCVPCSATCRAVDLDVHPDHEPVGRVEQEPAERVDLGGGDRQPGEHGEAPVARALGAGSGRRG